DLRRARAAKCLEVALLVSHVPDRQRDDLETHALEVRPGQGSDGRHESLALAIDVLDRERADGAAQVALDRLHRGTDDVLAPAREELRGRVLDALVAPVDLDHADAVDLDRDAVHRVGLGAAHVELHQLERQALHLLSEGPHVGAAAADDPVALAAGDDQHLVRADLRVLVRPNGESDQGERDEHRRRDDCYDHAVASSVVLVSSGWRGDTPPGGIQMASGSSRSARGGAARWISTSSGKRRKPLRSSNRPTAIDSASSSGASNTLMPESSIAVTTSPEPIRSTASSMWLASSSARNATRLIPVGSRRAAAVRQISGRTPPA